MTPKQRRRNKETALEPTLEDESEVKKDRYKLTQDPPTPQQQKLPFDQGVEQGPNDPEPHRQKPPRLRPKAREIELGGAYFFNKRLFTR